MKLVIVGGVAGGASAAARARRLSEDAEIVVFERGPDVSFANCGLPYYIGGEIAERKKLLVTSPELLRTRFKLDLRTQSLVESIDPKAKTVRVRDLTTQRVYEAPFDKLILATGAAPVRPPIPGIDAPGVYSLRDLQDTDRIKEHLNSGVKQVVLLGGGFISLELAENFLRQGVQVTVVEKNDQLITPFDKEMTTPILQALRDKGITVLLGQSAVGLEQTHPGLAVRLDSGHQLQAQMVVVGVGVRPENKLAVEAGLEVGPRGGIRVNEQMRTSDPNIYAVGDAIEVKDVVSGDAIQVPLAGPANRQGRIAADQVFGRSTTYRGTQGTAILGFFDRTIAITGASEKAMIRAKRAYRKVYIHPAHHAGYYPGAEPMTLKLLFEPDSGKLLGAQGVGGAGVDKRIDVLAVAIQAGLSVYDLEEMELAYAPQFGSAKDPINMLGFVAGGLVRDDHPQVDVEVVLAKSESEKPYLLDVRSPTEYASGHIPCAVNIPVDELRSRLPELPRDKPIAAYCQVGIRGYIATRILNQAGFRAANIGGGYKTYKLFYPQG
jgi:NADPH-dependent 2,4-dienoyl-CoA reductase/sulfur reductase-like enzyme/rhodanese-related sulfurtransferase